MLEVFALRADGFPPVQVTVAIFDGRRGQVIYRGTIGGASRRHGGDVDAPEPSKDDSQQQRGNLVLTGPHAAISADGCVAVEYFDNPGDEEEEDAGISTMLWDPYDAKQQQPEEEFQYDTPLTKSITAAEGRHLEMSYAVLRSAVEATVHVELLLSPQPEEGLVPRMERLFSSDALVHGEITAHTQLVDSSSGDRKAVSVLLFRREAHEALEVVRSFAGFPIPLSRSVLAWPCGSPIGLEVALHLQQPTSRISSSHKGTSTSSSISSSRSVLHLPFDADDHEEDKIRLLPLLEGLGYIRVSVNVTGDERCLPIVPSTMSRMDLLLADSVETDLLVVHPRQLRFTVEPSKQWIYSLLHITNDNRDEHVAFQLRPGKESPPPYYAYEQPYPKTNAAAAVSGILPPNTSSTYLVRLLKPPQSLDAFHMVLRSCSVRPLKGGVNNNKDTVDSIFQRASGEEVDEVPLKAVVCDPAVETAATSEPTQHGTGIKIIPGFYGLIDLHPSEPWILASRSGHISIWNYETMAEITSTARQEITSIKFIAPRGRFIAGDAQGYIHVYTFATMLEEVVPELVKAHKARVDSLAVHPSDPLVVLSASQDDEKSVKLWKYGEDDGSSSWKCIQTFGADNTPQYSMTIPVKKIKFNPNGDAFAGITQGGQVEMWKDISPVESVTKLRSDKFYDEVVCFDYFSFTGGGQLYMVTGSHNGTARIWDLQTNQCITQVEGLQAGMPIFDIWNVGVVQSHLGRPVLITASSDHVVSLYDCITLRCERLIDLKLGHIKNVLYREKTESLVVQCSEGIAVMGMAF